MEFIKLYRFVGHVISAEKIDRLIILKQDCDAVRYDDKVLEYLAKIPVDSTIAQLVAKETGLDLTIISIEGFKLSKTPFLRVITIPVPQI